MRHVVQAALAVPALAVAVAVAASTASCGHDDACGGHSHDPACLVCTGDENPLTPGTMVTASEGFTIALVSATPSPFVDANNELVVRIRKDGTLTDGVDFTGTQTWYPPGGHGSPLLPTATATGTAGEYTLGQINFLHPGRWELRFALAAGGAAGAVDVPVCIEDAP